MDHWLTMDLDSLEPWIWIPGTGFREVVFFMHSHDRITLASYFDIQQRNLDAGYRESHRRNFIEAVGVVKLKCEAEFVSFEVSDSVFKFAGILLDMQNLKVSASIAMTTLLGVICLAGYAAGSIFSFISNPADNILSSLNDRKG
ncbi:mitochondrial phosphate carrier protein 1 of mitochondrial isoform X1 [Spatholobus suberectus]|nr:mitochondrial phosphate carrier protein 1 of mitochondrial isoform X1 [Spatholobus suberectus]